MSEDCNLTIKGADVGEKIAIMDTVDYVEHCEFLLNDGDFCEKLHTNPKLSNAEENKQKIDDM